MDIDINALANEFGSTGVASPAASSNVDINALAAEFGSNKTDAEAPKTKSIVRPVNNIQSYGVSPDIASGLWQGVKDVPNTGAQFIGYLDDKIDRLLSPNKNLSGLISGEQPSVTGGSKRNEDFNKRLDAEKAALPAVSFWISWADR